MVAEAAAAGTCAEELLCHNVAGRPPASEILLRGQGCRARKKLPESFSACDPCRAHSALRREEDLAEATLTAGAEGGGALSPLSVSSKSARPQTEEVPRRNVGHQNSDLHCKDRLLLAFVTVLLGSPHDLDPGCNKSRSLPSQVAC